MSSHSKADAREVKMIISDCEQLLHLLDPKEADTQARSRVQQILCDVQEITLDVSVCVFAMTCLSAECSILLVGKSG